jgi:hypothetical protein
MMEAQRETGGLSQGARGSSVKGARVDDKPTLSAAGIDKHLADRARRYAGIAEWGRQRDNAYRTLTGIFRTSWWSDSVVEIIP